MTTETDSSSDSTDAETDMSQPDADAGFSAIVAASTLSETLNSVSVLVDESKIHLDEDGIHIRAVDPANVGMVDVDLKKEAFESYTASGGMIGVNLSKLEDILDMADSGSLVNLTLDEDTRKLKINIDDLEYTLALIDPEAIREEPDIPDLDLPGRLVFDANHLDRGIRAADMVSDHIDLSANGDDDTFEITATGDTDDVHLNLGEDDMIDPPAGDGQALFSLDYLKDMNKAIPSDAALTMELGDSMPVKLHYDFADGLGNTTFMLAPRIQND